MRFILLSVLIQMGEKKQEKGGKYQQQQKGYMCRLWKTNSIEMQQG